MSEKHVRLDGVRLRYAAGFACANSIGELKKPGVIMKDEWFRKERKGMTKITENSQLQIRMYAVQYKSPQALLFDGNTFLIVRFNASAEGDIAGCEADVIFMDMEDYGTLLQLDRLVAEGKHRLMAQH
ncbi:hypothetical protein LZ554_003017 [Drepanopeziza brunnea f. sp. 'monogermtubi']|nr:hypothetical protein LZ554_003017 [Drepanopeziza brunnea f. sp. 'monogermtubi']